METQILLWFLNYCLFLKVFYLSLFSFLEENRIAYDINSYRDAPIGIRIWGGATVYEKDIDILLDWLEWCFIKFIRE